jgi:hypothetical protein
MLMKRQGQRGELHQQRQGLQPQSLDQGSKVGFSPHQQAMDQQQELMQQQLQQLEQQYEQLQQQQQQQQLEQQRLASQAANYPNQQLMQLQEHQHQEHQVLMQQGALHHHPQHQQIQLGESEDREENFILPSTMVPPSVLASMFAAVPSNLPKKAGKTFVKPRKKRFKDPTKKRVGDDDNSEGTEMTPQSFFCEILQNHGYDPEYRLKADDSEYDAVPSALQLASFGTHLVKAVHTSDSALLSRLLECGLSPNPCNQFRDSIVDLVCKRANLPIFECLLEHGTDLQVVDGFGRTPLHHCCWASTFCRPIVEKIMERDPIQFFLEDKHGQTPLEYVRKDVAGEWMDFLEEVAARYWPVGGRPPRLFSPKSRRPDGHLVDPPIALSVVLAAMVSSGTVTPEQIGNMDEVTRRTYET